MVEIAPDADHTSTENGGLQKHANMLAGNDGSPHARFRDTVIAKYVA